MDNMDSMETIAVPKTASQRRAGKLRELLDGLAHSDMTLEDVALLLGCSPSSARNYVLELLDADLVTSSRGGPVRGRVASAIYSIRRAVSVAEPVQASGAAVPAMAAAQQDPLLMALFGGKWRGVDDAASAPTPDGCRT